MVLTLAAFGVALASFVALVVIVGRKVPTLLTLDPGKLPKHQVTQKKRRILEARIDRRMKAVEGAVVRTVGPLFKRTEGAVTRALERVHRKVATTAPPAAQTVATAASLGEALTRCERAATAGRWEQLEEAALAAIKLDPKNLEAYRYLGTAALGQEEYNEARQVYEYLVKRGYAGPGDYIALGTAAIATRDADAAEEAYAAAIALEPENPEHRLSLAEARLTLERKIPAFEAAADALRTSPNNPRVIDAYVRIAIAAGKPGFALDGVRRLETVNPENGKIKEYQMLIEQEFSTLPKRRTR
jgi:tetratricopeptide (TPR) repeat protein